MFKKSDRFPHSYLDFATKPHHQFWPFYDPLLMCKIMCTFTAIYIHFLCVCFGIGSNYCEVAKKSKEDIIHYASFSLLPTKSGWFCFSALIRNRKINECISREKKFSIASKEKLFSFKIEKVIKNIQKITFRCTFRVQKESFKSVWENTKKCLKFPE